MVAIHSDEHEVSLSKILPGDHILHIFLIVFRRRDMQQMERDIELNEAQKQHLMHKLQELVIQTSQLDVEAMVYESNQKRMGRAKQRMMYINRFASVISETMTISEKLWILMQLDMERMKNRSKFDSKLDAYRLELLACNRRIVSAMSALFSDFSLKRCLNIIFKTLTNIAFSLGNYECNWQAEQ